VDKGEADTLAGVAIAGKKNLEHPNFPSRHILAEPLLNMGGRVMEWFNKKTSIAGVQISNWMIVLGAIIVILIIYTSIH
jgi:hypothetical protein